jgi:anaphase-promoting complex subunit 8
MSGAEQTPRVNPIVVTGNEDPEEAFLEAKDAHRYLLAKSYFDCREYDRCAAVFLPSSLPLGPLSSSGSPQQSKSRPSPRRGSKADKNTTSTGNTKKPAASVQSFPRISQKSLFLALYAKYMAGEKRKDEDSEMVLGPADGGSTINKELSGICAGLEKWFSETAGKGKGGQGWLEYLYVPLIVPFVTRADRVQPDMG